MDVSFLYFVNEMGSSAILTITVLLTLGVIFVNGWTDAPNAIATCITTRCMEARSAIITSAIFNFLGVLVMTHINSSVAATISNIVDFGGDTGAALIALCAALFSIVVYSVGASYFGIPTSESHSLIAGLTGAAFAINNGFDAVNAAEWVKVIYGLVMSLALGFGSGWCVCRLITIVCAGMDRRKTNVFFKYAQIFGAAAMSFMHGAQDGQKFIGVLFLGMAFCHGHGARHERRRREDNPLRRHGHGAAREIPGLLRRPRGGLVPAAVEPLRNPSLHDAHEDQRDYGRRRGDAPFGDKLRRRQGHDAYVDIHLPRLRPHQLRDGEALHGRPLKSY